MAFETDLLEYEDLFDGNQVVDAKGISSSARHELETIETRAAFKRDRIQESASRKQHRSVAKH